MWNVLAPRICRASAKVLERYLNDYYSIDKTIKVNWGNSRFSLHDPHTVFGNKTEAVYRSANKQEFFRLVEGTVPVIQEFDGPCYQHLDTFGHNGSGVKYVDKQEDFIPYVLTTKRIEGKEFRAYFCYDSLILIYRKDKLSENIADNPVANSVNGYGYSSKPWQTKSIKNFNATIKSLVQDVARKLELSYGAVDFIMDKNYTVYILESNSAPTLFNADLVQMFGDTFAERWQS